MNRLVYHSRVDSDGVLRIAVPVGVAEANREMEIAVQPVELAKARHEHYVAWLHSIAGQWQGDFERPPQLQLEERDPL